MFQLLLLTGVIFVLSDWRPALNLAVLDCADETNSDVCRDFNIAGFPTVRVCVKGERELGMVLAEHTNHLFCRSPAPSWAAEL